MCSANKSMPLCDYCDTYVRQLCDICQRCEMCCTCSENPPEGYHDDAFDLGGEG
jgi:hypothetical protein